MTFSEPDGVTQITGPIADGATAAPRDVIVRIAVPPGAATDAVDTTTVTATTVSGGTTYTDSVTDHTTVRMLDTYEDAGYVNAQREFYLTDMIYARATGLAPGSYSVNLVISSDDPDEPTITVPVGLTVLQPADITGVTYTATFLQVAFDATVVGEPPLTYAWSFGDGGISNL